MKPGHKSLPEKKQSKNEIAAEKQQQNLISPNNGSQTKEPHKDNNVDVNIKKDEAMLTAVENGCLAASVQGQNSSDATEAPCIQVEAQKNDSISQDDQHLGKNGELGIEEIIAAKIVTEAMEAALALSVEEMEKQSEENQANECNTAEDEALSEWMKVDTRNALVIEETTQDNPVKCSNEPLLLSNNGEEERKQEIAYHEVIETRVENQDEAATVHISSDLSSPPSDLLSEASNHMEAVPDQAVVISSQESPVNVEPQAELTSRQPTELETEFPAEVSVEKNSSPYVPQAECDLNDLALPPPPPPISADDVEIQEPITEAMNFSEPTQNMNEEHSVLTQDEVSIIGTTQEAAAHVSVDTQYDQVPVESEHCNDIITNQNEAEVPVPSAETEATPQKMWTAL